MDKTPFDYDLPMYEKELSEQNCTKQECFLYMFNDEDHKTFFWYPMTLSGRGVCVIKSNEGESGTEPPGSGEDVDQRLREIDQKINSTSSIINDSITKLSNDYKTDIQKMDRRMSNIESKFQDFINVIDGIKKLLARIEKST
jgi:septal ring factor EnvC (AmiA/AmiB activator)